MNSELSHLLWAARQISWGYDAFRNMLACANRRIFLSGFPHEVLVLCASNIGMALAYYCAKPTHEMTVISVRALETSFANASEVKFAQEFLYVAPKPRAY